MTPDASLLRFYADESALGVGKALAIARKDVVHAGHPLIRDELPFGTLDPDWIPVVAAKGWVVICRDKRIRTKPVELALLKAHGLRVFWIAGRRDMDNWGNLRLLVGAWDRMERIIATRGTGPWFFAVNDRTINELPL